MEVIATHNSNDNYYTQLILMINVASDSDHFGNFVILVTKSLTHCHTISMYIFR